MKVKMMGGEGAVSSADNPRLDLYVPPGQKQTMAPAGHQTVTAMLLPLLLRLLAVAAGGALTGAATAALPAANFSRVPISSWCGNQTGPLSPAVARAFALPWVWPNQV